jgi:hypothetical protein
MHRRELLRSAGSLGLFVTLAGCGGSSDTGANPATDDSGGDNPDSGEGEGDTDATTPRPPPSVDLDFLSQIGGQPIPEHGAEPTLARTYEQDARALGVTSARRLRLEIPEKLYEYYQSRPRLSNYGVYGGDQLDDPFLSKVASYFESYQSQAADEIDGVAKFVQSLDSVYDRTGHDEYLRYPIEALVEKRADSEDGSLLLAGLLGYLGYDTALLYYPKADHFAVGVAAGDDLSGPTAGGGYYHVEAALRGPDAGQKPTLVLNQDPKVISIDPAPSLAFNYEVVFDPPESRSVLDVELSVHNLGNAKAVGVSATAAFEGIEEQALAGREQDGITIPAEESKSVTLSFVAGEGPIPPGDRRQRLRASVSVKDATHYAVTSEYFSPGS